MSAENTNKENIKAALAALPAGDFLASAQGLLETLGYHSELTPELQGSVAEVMNALGLQKKPTNAAHSLSENARSVGFVFQVGEDEINANGQQTLDWGPASFERGHTQRFNFVAVALSGKSYARGKYAEFTREINAWFNAPTVILFKTAANRLTLAFVHRRQHRHDHSRDVLGSVSLVREINPTQPHRAHLDILAELSLENLLSWMSGHNKPSNFDGLLAAWLDTLNTEALNKRFYTELFRWFEWAVGEATFPTQEEKVLQPEEHIIRLITRLLFVWFIKEKGLVAEDVFNETQIADLLRNYDGNTGDTYYRAVLQNLFFATLNTEMDKRGFSTTKNSTHRNFSRYRYKSEISDPEKLLALFARTPFINGGLFDCLDSEEGIRDGGYRIDCFSDNERHYTKLSIPNRLFFDPERGLFPLLNHYKFTVEENTPIEQEVALDPELLGKVFENLLAAYNPETRQTARKQTGSYYTPRAVVDYMVDEALVAALAQKCSPADSDAKFWQERLHYLLNYEDAFNDADELFDAQEAEDIVRAIADLTVLDPAVGSGAFPMGVLHKLTLALGRIDPTNTRWAALQKERAREKADAAFETRDQQERDTELLEISETFEKYSGDFGRKLYLIQNSIFGVDIQPIAGQIAKLRFFISLAIEQEPHKDAKNFGIRPLPNLETRFIAADTLLSLYKPAQLSLGQTEAVTRLERELSANRERHFHATTRRKKLACRKRDRELRDNLGAELQQVGWSAGDANKIAQWDPYDQNAKADWFDAEYMFGVVDGFDVVIGNPPYVQLQKNAGALGKLYKDAGFVTFARTGDVYYLFYEKASNLLKPGTGCLCFISSNQWMRVDSGQALREFIESQNPRQLVNLGASVFDSVTVNTCILLINRAPNKKALQAAEVQHATQQFPPTEWTDICPANGETWIVLSENERSIKDKMETAGTPLKAWDVSINYGVKTGLNDAFIIDEATKQALIDEDPQSAEIIKPVLRGRDIHRYWAKWAGLGLIDTHNGYSDVPAVNVEDYSAIKGYLDGFHLQLKKRQDKGKTPYNLRSCAYYEEFAKEKLVWGNLSNQTKFSYAPEGMFVNAPATILTPFSHYLIAVLNSKLLDWYFRLIGVERDGGYYEYKPMFIERLPVPKIPAAEQRPFIRLVDSILQAKAADPSADTGEMETEIDRLVYGLYGLTAGEIGAVEGTL